MQPKHVSLLLFASLGINLFLGGMWVGTLFDAGKGHPHGDHPHHAVPPHEKALPTKLVEAPQDQKRGPFSDRDDRTPTQRRDGRRGGEPGKRGGAEGPDDLVLLRRMVQIMGGPNDARVQKLREASREDIREIRREMRAAHQRVEQALSAEPLDEEALRAALTELSEKGTLARTRAQTGIVKLATLMTPEERKKLREKAPPRNRGPNKKKQNPSP